MPDILNKHIIENHVKKKKGKSRFYNKALARLTIKTLLQLDRHTLVLRDRQFSDRTVLLKLFDFAIGEDSERNVCLYIGKVVLNKKGRIITAYPTYK